MESASHALHLYEIAVDPPQPGETSLVESSSGGVSECSPQADLRPSLEVFKTGPNLPLTALQTDPSSGGENLEVVVMSECLAGEGQAPLLNGITAAILTQGHGLLMSESALGCTGEAAAAAALCAEDICCTTEDLSNLHEGHETQVIAYFETIPSVFSSEIASQCSFSPDTVLSSALSSKPITSTLPIVSKHVAPSPAPVVLTLKRLDTDEGDGDDGQSEEDSLDQQDPQLEEHW